MRTSGKTSRKVRQRRRRDGSEGKGSQKDAVLIVMEGIWRRKRILRVRRTPFSGSVPARIRGRTRFSIWIGTNYFKLALEDNYLSVLCTHVRSTCSSIAARFTLITYIYHIPSLVTTGMKQGTCPNESH